MGLCTCKSFSNKTLSQNQKFSFKCFLHCIVFTFFSHYFSHFLSEKSTSPLMLNTITFNTSCKPKLLHWRGTRATKCSTIFLNKHANVCIGPPSNLPRVSALFRVVELSCFCEIKTTRRLRAARVLHGGWVSTTDSAGVLSSRKIEMEKFAQHPFFTWGHTTHTHTPCTLKCCPLSFTSNSPASSCRAQYSRTSAVTWPAHWSGDEPIGLLPRWSVRETSSVIFNPAFISL